MPRESGKPILGQRVADALGLDVNNIFDVQMDMGVGQVDRVKVSMFLTKDQQHAIIGTRAPSRLMPRLQPFKMPRLS